MKSFDRQEGYVCPHKTFGYPLALDHRPVYFTIKLEYEHVGKKRYYMWYEVIHLAHIRSKYRVKILGFSLPVSGVRLGKRSAIIITERKNKGGLSRPKPASFFSVPLPITRRPFISLRFINWAPGTGQVAPLATVKNRDPNIAFRAICNFQKLSRNLIRLSEPLASYLKNNMFIFKFWS